jgi:hypothetical protein
METEYDADSEKYTVDESNSDTESDTDYVTFMPSEEFPLQKRHLVYILSSLQLACNDQLSLSKDKFLALLNKCDSESSYDYSEDTLSFVDTNPSSEEKDECEDIYQSDSDDSDARLVTALLSSEAIEFLICVIKAGITRLIQLNKTFLRIVVKNLDIYDNW